MTGCKYQFCVGCLYRTDVGNVISCPSDFNPFDEEKCPRNDKFRLLESRKRPMTKHYARR